MSGPTPRGRTAQHSDHRGLDVGLDVKLEATKNGVRPAQVPSEEEVTKRDEPLSVCQDDAAESPPCASRPRRRRKPFPGGSRSRQHGAGPAISGASTRGPPLSTISPGTTATHSVHHLKKKKNRWGRINTFEVEYVCLIKNIVLLNIGQPAAELICHLCTHLVRIKK